MTHTVGRKNIHFMTHSQEEKNIHCMTHTAVRKKHSLYVTYSRSKKHSLYDIYCRNKKIVFTLWYILQEETNIHFMAHTAGTKMFDCHFFRWVFIFINRAKHLLFPTTVLALMAGVGRVESTQTVFSFLYYLFFIILMVDGCLVWFLF